MKDRTPFSGEPTYRHKPGNTTGLLFLKLPLAPEEAICAAQSKCTTSMFLLNVLLLLPVQWMVNCNEGGADSKITECTFCTCCSARAACADILGTEIVEGVK